MKHKNTTHTNPLSGVTIVKLATLALLTIAYLCTGCEVTKARSHHTTDSVSVNRSSLVIDSTNQGAAVKTETNRSQEEKEWTKLTLQYLASQQYRDTTIHHFIPQPSTIIYETGRSDRNDERTTVDSNWYLNTMRLVATAFDSVHRKVEEFEKAKHTETKGISLISIALIVLGVVVCWKVGIVKIPRSSG